MQTPDDYKKQEAVNALIKIAVFEGLLLIGVVGVYFATQKLNYLFFGLAGVFLISGPLFFRWFNEHGKAINSSKPNSAVGDDG
ncbi:MAG: hypothetical protein HKN14_10725 [Marinicaulis sp.]|nr:hypothetical protein [Marinicaulis sp.]NNE41375.1 hypothetical protein [Marinicaulis sp.]NNL89457.1 hypothetical protein [Marinicaulis sp.]